MKDMELIVIDKEEFNCLVRGGTIIVGKKLAICLEEMTYEQMFKAIFSATLGIDLYKDRIRD